jgi:hypothetical protein
MLQKGPHMPSMTGLSSQPPSKGPFNLNCSLQRAPIREEASRARITGESFEGRRPQGCLAKGSPPPFTHCARMQTVGCQLDRGLPQKQPGFSPDGSESGSATHSVPGARNFPDEIYSSGPLFLRGDTCFSSFGSGLLLSASDSRSDFCS